LAWTAFYFKKKNYLNIACIIIVELVGFDHIAIAEFHDFEDVVAMLFFNELNVHGLVWRNLVKVFI
jgi:hypothetical protein